MCLHCTDKVVNSVQGNNSSLRAFAKHIAVTDLVVVRPSVRNSASPIDWIFVPQRTSLLLIWFLHTSILFRNGQNNTLYVAEIFNGNRLRCVWDTNRDLKYWRSNISSSTSQVRETGQLVLREINMANTESLLLSENEKYMSPFTRDVGEIRCGQADKIRHSQRGHSNIWWSKHITKCEKQDKAVILLKLQWKYWSI
jgi:hypothetical protein